MVLSIPPTDGDFSRRVGDVGVWQRWQVGEMRSWRGWRGGLQEEVGEAGEGGMVMFEVDKDEDRKRRLR